MSRRILLAALALLIGGCAVTPRAVERPSFATPGADELETAWTLLERERDRARSERMAPPERVRRLTRLGLVEEAERVVADARADVDLVTAEAELRFRQHRYSEAQALVSRVLERAPRHRGARLLQARLEVQAWRLPEAIAQARSIVAEHPRDAEAAVLLGRIEVLRREYDAALEWAAHVQQAHPGHAGGHLLEAEARFWKEDPAGAEPPLRRALELDPFDPDARFSYGYAIWRRVDATQLDAMAGHWNLALAVDPLHYVTHWHIGNGHTNLTYADYAHPTDEAVRARLASAEEQIWAGRVDEALSLARRVDREFPESVLPAMFRGSVFYMAYGMDRAERLDSAQTLFSSILERKRNYGPAHNGLAAVIKQRQFQVLAAFDSLEAEIARTPTPYDAALEFVFPDIRYYPGFRVEQMVRQQLGPSIAYLPMILRQGRQYRIPPLHRDLADAMERPFFRTATTFDNRQWMDIRGVGSGAAGIEYVERGSHQERDVFLHELVHLFHSIVFTDEENRRVRDLYHRAVAEDRALDYYAANNESEFLAQAYPAMLSPIKIHPLNHKAMATRDLLERRDPATFAFLDSLISRQEAYLAGDRWALRSNWAQVYVNLSGAARTARDVPAAERHRNAVALLDSAMVWDDRYLPALLSYAALERDHARFSEAERWLGRAEALDPRYAPVQLARAELARAMAAAGRIGEDVALNLQIAHLRAALDLEPDLALRAQLNQGLRELFRAHALLPEAIATADAYVANAPTISTYLRDRRDEAAAFAAELRSEAGYAGEGLPFFRALVAQKPQQYTLRAQFVDALVAAGEHEEALRSLDEVQRILRAGGTLNPAFQVREAELRLRAGNVADALAAVQPVLDRDAGADEHRLIRVLYEVGQTTEANRRLEALPTPATPAARAQHAFTRGTREELRGDLEAAERLFREALSSDPYLAGARGRLIAVLRATGRSAEAAGIVAEADRLPLPAGPDLHRVYAAALMDPAN